MSGNEDSEALTGAGTPELQEAARTRRCAQIAKDLFRVRRARARTFGEDATLFGEPAWDILLSLYIAFSNDRDIAIKKAATAGEVAQTTGLRLLTDMKDRGLLTRTDDPNDRRRSFVRLTARGIALMETTLLAIRDDSGPNPYKRRERSR